MNRHDRRRQLAEQRRLPVAPESFERVMEADRRFFTEHPGRRFYIRKIHEEERAQRARATGKFHCTDKFVVVEELKPGVRIRASFSTDGEFDCEQPEQECRRIFFSIASPSTLDLRALLLDT
jgi:hypothetical protein